MKNLFKSSCLVLALLASVALVGCGGGGGGSSSAPVNTQSSEAKTAKSSVTSSVVPVVNNFSTILNGGVTASFRTSTTNNKEVFSMTDTNNSIVAAMEAPILLRAVIAAVGGNIEGGLWKDENNYMDSYSINPYIEVASYSGKVYERTLYYNPEFHGESTDGTLEIAAHYIIDGCNAVLENKILKSLTINPNAKITIENFKQGSFGKKYKTLIKGTIDSDLSVKWVGEEKNYKDSESLIIDCWSGEKITDNSTYYGFKVTSKTTSYTTYSLSKPIKLILTKFYDISYHYNDYRWYDNGYGEYDESVREFEGDNIEITISGISGSVKDKKVNYSGEYVVRNGSEWAKPNYGNYVNGNLVFKEKTDTSNLVFSSPVKISLSGSLTNNEENQVTSYSWSSGQENTSAPTHVASRKASINNVTVSLNKISGKIDSIVVDDAEAHVDIGDYNQDKVIMIGDTEVAFNKAKVDVTGLKYDYRWEPNVDEGSYQQINEYWGWVSNPEYDRQVKERDSKCFGNSIVKISATESKNNVTITANCDINKQTATAHLVNNGNTYKLKDDVTEFDFRTLDINATKVDVLADKNCEGAELAVTCVEKNNTTTKRNYKVVNGKLVRSDSKEVDVKVPTEIQELDSNEIAKEISELPKEELKPIETKDGSEFKVAKKDGKSFATYNKGKETDKVKVQTNIIGMTNSLFAISFFTDNNKTYTILFVIENKNGKKLINGSIFNGKQPGLDSKDRYNGDFAKFNSDDGKKITVLPIKGTVFNIPIQ